MKLVILAALVALPLAGRVPVTAAPAARSASTTAHGVRITLAVPPVAYPRNGLIAVVIRVTNVSTHAIVYYPSNICAADPQVEVTNARGILEYPPAIAGAPIASCGPRPVKLPQIRPGKTRVWHSYAILGGSHLRASISLSRRQVYVDSPTITLHLVSTPKPVSVVRTSPRYTLQITPPAGVTGPLLYSSWWGCKVSNGTEFGGNGSGWLQARDDTISPPWDSSCESEREWHIVAGWVGQPVVVANVGRSVAP